MSLTYKDAGVDIDAGASLVERIKEPVRRTTRPEVIGGLGGFGALTELPAGYKQPVLVSSTDGVGTKLRLAIDLNRHSTVGIDLVAMCVNDLIVQGAEPLLFLDYYATGRLDVDVAAKVIEGIAEGCSQAGCALVGGETAEMPGMYGSGDYDLAGFSVGVVEKSKILDGSGVREGDAILALASSGPHSNGYSLIRHILKKDGTDPLKERLGSGELLADALLAPTRIYVKPVLRLLAGTEVHALAHITGGGFWENIPRVLPPSLCASCDRGSWEIPEVFTYLKDRGGVDDHEMLRTFNCGVGMVIILPSDRAGEAIGILQDCGEKAWMLGSITKASGGKQVTVA